MLNFSGYIDPRQRYVRRPGVYAILPRDGQLLVTFQAGIHGEVQLPGGGIDPGEAPIPALHREVMEETGYSITRPRLLGRFRRKTYMPEYDMWADKICQIYVARPVLCKGPPVEEEHRALWLDPMDAIDLLALDGDAFFVSLWLDGAKFQ